MAKSTKPAKKQPSGPARKGVLAPGAKKGATAGKTVAKKAQAAGKKAARPKAPQKAAGLPARVEKLRLEELSLAVSEAERQGWSATTEALTEEEIGFSGPISVLLGESVDVARFARLHWEPELGAKGTTAKPGLKSAVRPDLKPEPYAATPVLHAGTAQEILALSTLTQEAHTRYLLSATSASGVHPRAEASALLSDLHGVATSYLDDGVETDEDAQLRTVEQAHASDPTSDDALAGALFDYAALVESLRPGIDAYADFSPDWLAQARALVAALRASPGPGATLQVDPKTAPIDPRNRFATLLARRLRLVRTKARYVFRKHPALLREVNSAYERRRRSARKGATKPT